MSGVNASSLPDASQAALLSSVLERAPLSVIAYDTVGRVVLWNAEAERLFGWRAIEVVGKPAPFALGDVRIGVAAHEVTRTSRTGGVVQLSVTVQQISLDGGGTLVVEMGTDLGDRRRLESQVVQGVRLEAVARLAAGIAHDFNNILAAIKCSIDLIGDSIARDDSRSVDVQAIADATSRAAELTRQLLAFTRQQVLVPQIVNLNAVARGAERMLLGIAGDEVGLALELANESVHVRADASQLEQALIHLVVNAREATPNGGRITLSTGRERLDRDPTGGEVPIIARDYGWLRVADTGHGVHGKLLGRIFEPFFTTKQRSAGTGLGLSAVYGIVKQSGGYTFVRSEPEEGAVFTIYLPLVGTPAVSQQAIPAAARTADTPATILLVEDESALRGLMKRILERSGYRVIEAEDGAKALEQCTLVECEVDLVVSDIVMPTMGGREMADRIRELRPAMRLLFVSGFSDDEVLRQGVLTAGASYLQKPFSPAALTAKVAEMLRGSHPEPAAPLD